MFKNDVERSVKEVKGVKNVKKAATAGLKLRGMNETLRRRFRSKRDSLGESGGFTGRRFSTSLRAYPEIFLGFPQSFGGAG
jgi:hypothetical protein